MNLWVVTETRGLDYDGSTTGVLGVFSSYEKAYDHARIRFEKVYVTNWAEPFRKKRVDDLRAKAGDAYIEFEIHEVVLDEERASQEFPE